MLEKQINLVVMPHPYHECRNVYVSWEFKLIIDNLGRLKWKFGLFELNFMH